MLDEKPRSRGGGERNGGAGAAAAAGSAASGRAARPAVAAGWAPGGRRAGRRAGRARGRARALRDARVQPPFVDEEQESYRDANVEPIAGLSLHDYLIGRAALPSMPGRPPRLARWWWRAAEHVQGGRRPNTTQDARGNRRLGLGRLNPSERDFAAPHRHAMPMGL